MSVFSLPSKNSNAILLVLFLVIGFVPIELNAFFFFSHDDGWFMEWYNESLAWGLLLLTFHVLAVCRAAALFRQAPALCAGVVFLAIFGIWIVVAACMHDGLGPCSKGDSPNLEMWQFWNAGGGWLTWIIILPLAILYLVVRLKQQKAQIRQS